MSLDQNISDLATAIGQEIKDVRADMALISGGGGGSSIPIGSIIQMKTYFPPNGFLICDGTNIEASLYSSEFLSYLTSDFVINASGFGAESEILDTSPDSVGDITSILADGDPSTNWTPFPMQSEYSFTIQLAEPTIITGYELFTANGNRFKKYSFLGSNDGTNYTLIDNQISQALIYGNAKIGKVFVNETSYLYYKFVFIPTPKTNERPAISYVILYIDASGETMYTLPNPEDINPSHNYIYKYLIKAE